MQPASGSTSAGPRAAAHAVEFYPEPARGAGVAPGGGAVEAPSGYAVPVPARAHPPRFLSAACVRIATLGPASPTSMLDADGGDGRRIGRGEPGGIEVGQDEALDAVDDGLGAAARITAKNRLAGTEHEGDALARRIDDAVAVQIPLKRDARRFGESRWARSPRSSDRSRRSRSSLAIRSRAARADCCASTRAAPQRYVVVPDRRIASRPAITRPMAAVATSRSSSE